MVLVGTEDNLEDVVVVVIDVSVVGEDEDNVGMDQTVQGELQKYVVEVDNTWDPCHAVVADLDEEVAKNEEVMVVKKVK